MSKTAVIYSKEDERRYLVRNILLQDEKDLLHTQLVESERWVDELERGQVYNQNQLATAQKNLDKAQQDLRVKSRDNNLLKVCAFRCRATKMNADENQGGIGDPAERF